MSSQWLKSFAPDETAGLLEELVAESDGEERIAILFNLLQNSLVMAARGAKMGHGVLQRDAVVCAVSIISFLRSRLRSDSASIANGVLRRFYNSAHRQIIKAHRDEAAVRFEEIRTSVSKVIQKPYSSSFFYNCMQETSISPVQMLDLLLSSEVRQSICRIDASMFAFSNETDSGQA